MATYRASAAPCFRYGSESVLRTCRRRVSSQGSLVEGGSRFSCRALSHPENHHVETLQAGQCTVGSPCVFAPQRTREHQSLAGPWTCPGIPSVPRRVRFTLFTRSLIATARGTSTALREVAPRAVAPGESQVVSRESFPCEGGRASCSRGRSAQKRRQARCWYALKAITTIIARFLLPGSPPTIASQSFSQVYRKPKHGRNSRSTQTRGCAKA